ncbi:MAG: alpha/beta fold hydrolase [Oscillospiraceae bacterium]|nr:alpha/beta fold hydrolase [Oscillospiraceae bacterium]
MHRYFEINARSHNIRCKLYCDGRHEVGRVVIFCHGFGSHKDNSAAEKFAERLVSKYKNAAMVTFNWPCHGDDVKSKLCLDDCMTYLELVVSHVRQQFGEPQLYCYGTSFGGYLMLRYLLQHENPFVKIALRCPAVNMYEVLTGTIMTEADRAKLQKGKEIPVGFDRKVMIGTPFLEELRTNDIQKAEFFDHADSILILHGTEDEIVPICAVRDFCEQKVIEFLPVEGADHRFRDPKKMEQAIKHILEFYAL